MKTLPLLLALALSACAQTPGSGVAQGPAFRVDPAWPKPLPEENGVQLVVGQVAGIAVDERNGHVWIIHRPSTLLADEWNAKEARPVTHRCCKSLPPVAEFDAAGNYLRGWAGSGGGRAQKGDRHLNHPPGNPLAPRQRGPGQ